MAESSPNGSRQLQWWIMTGAVGVCLTMGFVLYNGLQSELSSLHHEIGTTRLALESLFQQRLVTLEAELQRRLATLEVEQKRIAVIQADRGERFTKIETLAEKTLPQMEERLRFLQSLVQQQRLHRELQQYKSRPGGGRDGAGFSRT